MSPNEVKANKLEVNFPFGIGKISFVPDEVEKVAAWELYVELTTRIAVQSLNDNEGLLREALSSLYALFPATREILRKAGPRVAHGPASFGPLAIRVLNEGLRPFTAYWHPILEEYEADRPPSMSKRDYEKKWTRNPEFREKLKVLQQNMLEYAKALAIISGIDME